MAINPLINIPQEIPQSIISFPEPSKTSWRPFFYECINRSRKAKIPHRCDIEEPFAQRRFAATFNLMDDVVSRYTGLLASSERDHSYDRFQIGYTWLNLCMCSSSYSYLESCFSLLTTASIWVLDQISKTEGWQKKLLKMFEQLPRTVPATIYYPKIDCQYSKFLIVRIQYILAFRNNDLKPMEEDESNHPRYFTDKITAERAKRRSVPSRKLFEELISMIPEESLKSASVYFEDMFWKWNDRLFKIVMPSLINGQDIIPKIEKQRIQANEERKKYISSMEEFRKANEKYQKDLSRSNKEASLKYNKNNPLFAQRISPLNPSLLQNISILSNEPAAQNLNKLREKMELSKIKYNAAAKDYESLANSSADLSVRLNRLFSRVIYRDYFPEETQDNDFDYYVFEKKEPFCISDPFAICFAFLYLLDSGSDLPWAYGSCYGLMLETALTLPWNTSRRFENNYDMPKSLVASEYVQLKDWNGERYYAKAKEAVQPCTLSQLVYAETGYLLPRDMNHHTDAIPHLKNFGIHKKEAENLLTCMSIIDGIRKFYEDPYISGEYEVPDEESNEETLSEDSDDDLKEKNKRLLAEIQRLKTALHASEQAHRNTSQALDDLKDKTEMERQELAGLRELIFSRQSEIPENDITDVDTEIFPYEVDKATLVFGGHDTWNKSIKTMFTGDIRFISKDYIFDTTIINRAEVLWIQTNAISHKQYDRIMDMARSLKKTVKYFTSAGHDTCAKQIYDFDCAE